VPNGPLEMKADSIGSHNTFFYIHIYIFLAGVERSGCYTDADFSDVGYSAKSDQCRSGCGLI
jgi:hypothetical protein